MSDASGPEQEPNRAGIHSEVIFAVASLLAVVVIVAVAASGFSCSGGVIGEGCSSGSPVPGLIVGGLMFAVTLVLAWWVGRVQD